MRISDVLNRAARVADPRGSLVEIDSAELSAVVEHDEYKPLVGVNVGKMRDNINASLVKAEARRDAIQAEIIRLQLALADTQTVIKAFYGALEAMPVVPELRPHFGGEADNDGA